MHSRFPFVISVLVAAMVLLVGCNKPPVQADFRSQADAYIRLNIADLSPEEAVLGGRFTVTDVQWVDNDTALVTYEDGHVQFQGRTDVSVGTDGLVTATEIQLDANVGSSTSSSMDSSMMSTSSTTSNSMSSSMSVSARQQAMEGEFCGGIAGILCTSGLRCQMDAAYPDAGGTCVR